MIAALAILGLAIGISAAEPAQEGVSQISTPAWIWGIATAVISFFLGGFVAAKSAAVGGSSRGLLNGLIVGAATIVVTLLLVGTGVGTLLGAGATALGDAVNVGQNVNAPDVAAS